MKQHVDGEWLNKESLPDLSPDIEAVASYLTRKLGATKANVTKSTEMNEELKKRGLCLLANYDGKG